MQHCEPTESSPLIFKWFTAYTRRYIQRHFHAVRVVGEPPLCETSGGPVVIYLNHPSWWDPLACVIAAERYFADHRHYAPIDSKALRRYGILKRLGFFPVDQDVPARGGAQFLRTGKSILNRPDAVLWITAQGKFADVRRRPISLMAGLARLLQRTGGNLTVIPLAIEYPFWQERTPELLLNFGPPVFSPSDSLPADAHELGELLQKHLADAMDELAAKALSQDPANFETILGGRAGVGGFYDLWRRAGAFVRGKKFVSEHRATHDCNTDR